MQKIFQSLKQSLQGELYTDQTMRRLYATDASAYREVPQAVAIPKNENDIKTLVHFAKKNNIPLIPRAAGTSLAGQVVGGGMVVDISKYFTEILEINTKEGWVRVQPGVVRDDLNKHLASTGFFFAPETSTANRAMVGGMIGNNSCGANSIVYGSTREHLLEIRALLSNGEGVIFKGLDPQAFYEKLHTKNSSLESALYQQVNKILQDPFNQQQIRDHYPKASIPRRNTGYALDLLLETSAFAPESPENFNFCKLIAGSEGTLCFILEAKLKIVPLPPPHKLLVCVHCHSIDETLRANLVAILYGPSASELMDHYILERTKTNLEQQKNRFFIKGDPHAILVIEIIRESPQEAEQTVHQLIKHMQEAGLGYHYSIIQSEDAPKVWNLRKAGLGLLSNIPGDNKPVPVIEDTAVDVQELPEYIERFNEILRKHGLYSVHYAHAGSGELHLRPILNLKTQQGVRMFRIIAEEITRLVKSHKGSLSGEHGDGRLRGEFIPAMIGQHNYQLLTEVKNLFDPSGIFNPGKIVHTPPMDTSLRYEAGQATPEYATYLDFSSTLGIIRAAEMCNGSGDCRKTHLSEGTMCPSYMATRNEKDTTRARANILREILSKSDQKNPWKSEQIKEVMDLCLSCKGCKSECPSNVDVGKMKAEFFQQYYDAKGIPWRVWLIGAYTQINQLASRVPGIYNLLIHNKFTSPLIKKILGFATQRALPALHPFTLRQWYKHRKKSSAKNYIKKIYIFCDEFTNYNDTSVGIKTIELMEALGYEVLMPECAESGRTQLSKGLLKWARKNAEKNIEVFKDLISAQTPLIGIEPSAILSFRDEYPELVQHSYKRNAEKISKHTFLLEEFLAQEIESGNISKEQFSTEPRILKVHGHCHQKALSSLTYTKKVLSLPENYQMHIIASGCCGMAGSFGYEKEHYKVSMDIGELVLFPKIREFDEQVTIIASGTSCRHQIREGTGRKAYHLAEILWEALKK